MKSVFKTLAIATVALGVSGVVDTAAYALTNSEARQLKKDLRSAIGGLIVETELAMDEIDLILNTQDLPRDEERALLKERRILATEYRRLKTRRNRVNNWSDGQLNYWAAIYIPTTVSPS